MSEMAKKKATRQTPEPANEKGCKAPFRWRHSDLTQIKSFLLDRVADGSYTPLVTEGLD